MSKKVGDGATVEIITTPRFDVLILFEKRKFLLCGYYSTHTAEMSRCYVIQTKKRFFVTGINF